MVNGVGWDFLYNASMIRAAYEVYNGSAALNGFVFGILYFLFQAMLFYKTRKPMPGIVIGLFFLGMYYTNQFFDFIVIDGSIMWVAIIILSLEVAVLFYTILVKH